MASRAAAAPLSRLVLGSDPARRAIYVLGMVPAVFTFYLALTDSLGADPQKTLERTLGLWALRFLIIGLAISPLRPITGPVLIRYRRTVGLLAFYYAVLHVAVYVLLDQGLDWSAILADILKRPFITVGMLAFTLLVPLAVTSNTTMIRRLGGPAWNRLHRLVYVIAVAAALHFVMLVKSWTPELALYVALIAALLLFRVIAALRRRRARAYAARRGFSP
jgi:sulfoxide reductase heme-binding subunit YedZ